jgi:hypothetical protein
MPAPPKPPMALPPTARSPGKLQPATDARFNVALEATACAVIFLTAF